MMKGPTDQTPNLLHHNSSNPGRRHHSVNQKVEVLHRAYENPLEALFKEPKEEREQNFQGLDEEAVGINPSPKDSIANKSSSTKNLNPPRTEDSSSEHYQRTVKDIQINDDDNYFMQN